MNSNNIDRDNFSCVDMMRKIRNEIDAELAPMTKAERLEYFRKINLKYGKLSQASSTMKK